MHHRSDERALLKRKLEQGISVHMPAPRRIGKTWTVSRLAQDLRAAGWIAVEIDVEGMRTPHAFARELCVRIEEQQSIADRLRVHLLQRFENALGGKWGNNPLEALSHVDPIEFAETLIASLDGVGKKAVILIDEVAYFFLKMAEAHAGEAKDFAYRLRALQQRYKNVRWLLTGSIGLPTIARRYELAGAFVEFENFILEPFTPAQALSYMRDPAIQQQFTHIFDASDADFGHMFAELGWLAPFYLKMVANAVRPSIKEHGTAPPRATAGDFDAALEKLLQANRQSEFAVWREHINKNLPDGDRDIARCLLAALSAHRQGEGLDTLFTKARAQAGAVTLRQVKDILDMLVNDGLITGVADRYAFHSGLVRRYWHAYEAD
jgi:uncharacterized protein